LSRQDFSLRCPGDGSPTTRGPEGGDMRRASNAMTTIFLAAVAAAGLPGCGGGEEQAPPPEPAPVVDDSEARALATRAAAALGALPASAEAPDRPLTKARIDLGRICSRCFVAH